MTDYKMVTREDYVNATLVERELLVERLLKERDAYREVAIQLLEGGIPRPLLIALNDVDAEVLRLMGEANK